LSYNLSFYNNEIAKKRSEYFNSRPSFTNRKNDTNRIFFKSILKEVNSLIRKKQNISILDIGTGTGYVPDILCYLSKFPFSIVGVDLSKPMIKKAREGCGDKRVKYVVADNMSLPFLDASFNIVTNKLTTQFSIDEVIRVLKPGGYFIFKEYGKYKGFKELSNIFARRFKTTRLKPADYAERLYQGGLTEVVLQQYSIIRKYSIADINRILEMSSLITGYNSDDCRHIEKTLFLHKNRAEFTSDPFILWGRK